MKEQGHGLKFGTQAGSLPGEELRPQEENSFPGSPVEAGAVLRLPRHRTHPPADVSPASPLQDVRS